MAPNSVGVIDAATNELVAEIPVGVDPQAIAAGEGAVWAANVEDETVSRIDPADTTARPRTITVGGYPSDVTVDAGAVWVALGALGELVRVNPEQNEARPPIPALGRGRPAAGRRRRALPSGQVRCGSPARLRSSGASTSGRTRAGPVGLEAGLSSSPSSVLPAFADVAFGLDSLWIVDRNTNSIIEVDPVTIQKQRPINVGSEPAAIAVGTDSLWVANFGDDTVTRVQIPGPGQTPTLTHIPSATARSTSRSERERSGSRTRSTARSSRIDPATNEVDATIDVGNEPQRVTRATGVCGSPCERRTSKRLSREAAVVSSVSTGIGEAVALEEGNLW